MRLKISHWQRGWFGAGVFLERWPVTSRRRQKRNGWSIIVALGTHRWTLSRLPEVRAED